MREKIDFRPYLSSLASKAFRSCDSRGRRHSVENDDDKAYLQVFDPFLADQEKIRLSKSLRRLADKTQVFINHLQNSHVRNRRIHTDEVASLAAQISRILGLNVGLTEASALGHDLGHSPFGHLGERIISEIAGQTFKHEIMSVVIAQKVERSGRGLNLSWETLEAILHHSRGKNGLKTNSDLPLEYAVVMFADKIAYTMSDLNDALRCGFFTEKQLPPELFALGKNQRERWLNCLFALVKESSEEGRISFSSSSIAEQFETLRQWSYRNFYSQLDEAEQRQQAAIDLKSIYQFFSYWLPQCGYYSHDPLLVLALLTDQEAKKIAEFAQCPTIRDTKTLESFSFMELLSRFPQGHQINIFDADLCPEDFN